MHLVGTPELEMVQQLKDAGFPFVEADGMAIFRTI